MSRSRCAQVDLKGALLFLVLFIAMLFMPAPTFLLAPFSWPLLLATPALLALLASQAPPFW